MKVETWSVMHRRADRNEDFVLDDSDSENSEELYAPTKNQIHNIMAQFARELGKKRLARVSEKALDGGPLVKKWMMTPTWILSIVRLTLPGTSAHPVSFESTRTPTSARRG